MHAMGIGAEDWTDAFAAARISLYSRITCPACGRGDMRCFDLPAATVRDGAERVLLCDACGATNSTPGPGNAATIAA